MTKFNKISAGLLIAFAFLFSCQTEDVTSLKTGIPQETLAKISALGFGTTNVVVDGDGYLVEGDIHLTRENLDRGLGGNLLRVAEVEQYRTTNLVNAGSSRTITLSLDTKLPSSYGAALDEVIRRFNAENLTLQFSRVSSGATISFVSGNGSYLASAGFPTNSGNPFNQVKINARFIGNGTSTAFRDYVATIMAHELGHCIGFRHTDYMDRSYSCNGSATNEGAGTVGAILIPGTPAGPDAGSWMLACIGSGQNRPFNNNDKSALNYLY